MSRFFWVCLGGAAGTGARYLLGNAILRWLGPAFPYHTLTVNALGSFALGALMEASLATGAVHPTLRLALSTGVLGGFTTYSTFNYETVELVRRGAWLLGAANLAGTVVICALAGFVGIAAGRWAAGS